MGRRGKPRGERPEYEQDAPDSWDTVDEGPAPRAPTDPDSGEPHGSGAHAPGRRGFDGAPGAGGGGAGVYDGGAQWDRGAVGSGGAGHGATDSGAGSSGAGPAGGAPDVREAQAYGADAFPSFHDLSATSDGAAPAGVPGRRRRGAPAQGPMDGPVNGPVGGPVNGSASGSADGEVAGAPEATGTAGVPGAADESAGMRGHSDDEPQRDAHDDADAADDENADDDDLVRSLGRGRAQRREAARRIKRRRRRSALREVPILIGVALVIALVLKTFLVQAFVIPSGSMENTLRVGDRVLVDKFTPWFGAEPHRGDVVVFQDPGDWLKGEPQPAPPPEGLRQLDDFFSFIGLLPSSDQQDLIKRVIAVGGDHVKCCDTRGRIMVNGRALDEPYVAPGNPPSLIKFDLTVPAGRLWVMGDHRSNSADSRYHMTDPGGGTIPESLVVGKAFAVAWPVSHWRRLQEPATFAGIPPPYASAAGRVPVKDGQDLTQLPTPAELPIVMGVVGLLRVRRRQSRRSEESKWGTLWSAHGPERENRRAAARRWNRWRAER